MVEEQFGDFFMNILFIGLGSIGQRHLRNIKNTSKSKKYLPSDENLKHHY